MRKGKIWSMIGVTVLLVGLIAGCVPLEREMSYQGQLTDPAGNPVPNGSYQMTFRLYDDETAPVGTEVYSETQTVAVDGGLFNANLGAINPITPSTFFAGKLWLGVEVEGDGEMTPRQQLTGAPYAMSLAPGAYVAGTVHSSTPPGGTLFVANDGTGFGVGVLTNNTQSTGLIVSGAMPGEIGVGIAGYAEALVVTSGDFGFRIEGVEHGGLMTSTAGFGLHSRSAAGSVNNWWGVFGEGLQDGGGDGLFGWAYGTDDASTGLTGRAEEGRAVYAFTLGAGQYAGYFEDPIYVNGGCTGCTFSYIARNTSGVTLQPGDAVVAAGVEGGIEGMQGPVMKVAPAAPGKSVLGVAVGRTTMTVAEAGLDDVQPGAQFGPVGGAAAPGDYLVIVVQGPAQVKADPAASIQASSLVYLGAAGVTTEASGPAIGMALDAVDTDGLVWVLVGFR